MPVLPISQASASRTQPADSAEAVLLQRVGTGDRVALEHLYFHYQRRLSRFLGRHTRRRDLIEEVVNDTFMIVWQKAQTFRGESRVSTWIMGIAYRCMLKSLRGAGDVPLEYLPPERSDDHGGADHFDAHELTDWLSKGLSRLPPDQRVTIEFAYGMGHSLDEIAEIMDCPVGTVKARMFHARIKLRNLLPALAGTRGSPE